MDILNTKMRQWPLLCSGMLAFSCMILCQDIVFPTDEELSHLSGNNPKITDRIPVMIPGRCPENMLLYPGDTHNSTWVCDCRPGFLYFPLNDTCYEAYRRGPCLPGGYVVLPENGSVPQCTNNPCIMDGLVPYNNTCYPLRTAGGPCAPDGVLGINEITFKIECVLSEIAPFIIIQAPKSKCPMGSRRNFLHKCKRILY